MRQEDFNKFKAQFEHLMPKRVKDNDYSRLIKMVDDVADKYRIDVLSEKIKDAAKYERLCESYCNENEIDPVRYQIDENTIVDFATIKYKHAICEKLMNNPKFYERLIAKGTSVEANELFEKRLVAWSSWKRIDFEESK